MNYGELRGGEERTNCRTKREQAREQREQRANYGTYERELTCELQTRDAPVKDQTGAREWRNSRLRLESKGERGRGHFFIAKMYRKITKLPAVKKPHRPQLRAHLYSGNRPILPDPSAETISVLPCLRAVSEVLRGLFRYLLIIVIITFPCTCAGWINWPPNRVKFCHKKE